MKLEDFNRVDGCERVPAVRADSPQIGFVDAEGQGDKDVSYDANLICPILLASKCVIFNWKGDLQKDHILSTLGIMTRAAQNVVDQPDGRTGTSSRAKFGHLHIVFRDWQAVHADEESTYKALFDMESARDAATRNQIRNDVLEAFQSVRVWLFDAPTEKVADLKKKLTIEMTSGAFRAQLRALRRTLAGQLADPTVFANQPLTGRLLHGMVVQLVSSLNKGEAILPASTYLSMLQQEVAQLREEYGDSLRAEVSALQQSLLTIPPPSLKASQDALRAVFAEHGAGFDGKLERIFGASPTESCRPLMVKFQTSSKAVQEQLKEGFDATMRAHYITWLMGIRGTAEGLLEAAFQTIRDQPLLEIDQVKELADQAWNKVMDVLGADGGYAEHADVLKALREEYQILCRQVEQIHTTRHQAAQAKAEEEVQKVIQGIKTKISAVQAQLATASPPGVLRADVETELNASYNTLAASLEAALADLPSLRGRALEYFESACTSLQAEVIVAYKQATNAAFLHALGVAEDSLVRSLNEMARVWDAEGVTYEAGAAQVQQLAKELWDEATHSVSRWMGISPSTSHAEAAAIKAEHSFGKELEEMLSTQLKSFLITLKDVLDQQLAAQMEEDEEEEADEDEVEEDAVAVPQKGPQLPPKGMSVAEQRRRAKEWAVRELGPRKKATPAKKAGLGLAERVMVQVKSTAQQRADALAYAQTHFPAAAVEAKDEELSPPRDRKKDKASDKNKLQEARDAARKALEDRAKEMAAAKLASGGGKKKAKK